jgi:hypothetical protein
MTAARNESRMFGESAYRSVSISTNSYSGAAFRSGSHVGSSPRYGAALVVTKILALDGEAFIQQRLRCDCRTDRQSSNAPFR